MTDPNTRLSDLFTACWKDESMKRRLMAEPKAVLAEFGLPVPEALDVKVVENDENTVHITMPASPVQGAQLSDEELAEAAGGCVCGSFPTVADPNCFPATTPKDEGGTC